LAPKSPHAGARLQDLVDAAVARFGASVSPLLRAGVGQAEANLTAGVETLIRDVAKALKLEILSHRESADRLLGIRPDLAIDVFGARAGVVELKAPGFGVPGAARWGKSRDRAQWEKLKLLPNVLYTDGSQWAVYHYGERVGNVAVLDGDLARAGSKLRAKDGALAAILKEFLYWEPRPPRDLRELVRIAAGLCQFLREEVTEELANERNGDSRPLFIDHLADWQEWLFPGLTDDEFVDSYAQTITFGLLLARREGIHFEGLEIPDIGEKLVKRHLLVGRALSILTARPDRGQTIEERSVVLQTMRRVIGAADWTNWPTAGTYHWLYEEFLEAYDPTIRRQMGAYYTPSAVTDFMAGFVHQILQKKLRIDRGIADNNVVILDPAMGTGTFLQSVVDRVAETVSEEGGDIPAALRDLLTRLIGFERQIGPFAVAELKLDHALDAYGAEAKDEDFRLYVADTLDDPVKVPLPVRARLYAPLADSRRAANHVKTDEEVMVVLGNPPYRANARPLGKWVVDADKGKPSLLDDFRLTGNGRQEYKLHDLAIYFWRWALWKAFESSSTKPAGIVAFITTNAYLDGPGFAGMRRYLRQQADYGWIIDLSTEGHRSDVRTRVFPGVPHAVCIGIFARRAKPRLHDPARVRYLAVSGNQEEKFGRLSPIKLSDPRWLDCPFGWTTNLRPIQGSTWTRYPIIEDLFPLTSLGMTPNRAWVHSPDRDVLSRRWRALIQAESSKKRRLMKETRDRTIDRVLPGLPGAPTARPLIQEMSTVPNIRRIGFRSFDRQYIIADQRVVDFLRSDLWRIASSGQVYLVTQLQGRLTAGPAAVFTTDVPDVDYLHGRGGRVIPMFRDAARTAPNISPTLLDWLQRTIPGFKNEDLMAYTAAVVAHPGFTSHFLEYLSQPGLRVPLTSDSKLWSKAVEVGKRIIWLHTFGDWPSQSARPNSIRQLPTRPRVEGSVGPGVASIPDEIGYCASTGRLTMGSATLSPVSERVMAYEVSGMRIVKHWFDYRKRTPAGRRGGSDLDQITSENWAWSTTEELRDLIAVLEGCVRLEPKQSELLSQILAGPVLTNDYLENESLIPAPAHAKKIVEAKDDTTLF
jgi:hypothetical protein